ncbi:MAG: hypothetical protein Q9225_002221 [Loekoesia sp. 1 TL-2023]
MGPETEKKWQSARHGKANLKEFDQHHHRSRWWRVMDPVHRDGKDDITAVKLLQDSQKPLAHYEYIIVGRANGELRMISINHELHNAWKIETHFVTAGENIRSISVNSAQRPLHDLRSPASYVAAFTDLVDHFSAIYSLLPVGCGRFLAGGSNHSLLKVFDMRKVLKDLCCDSSLNHSSPKNQHATIIDPNSTDLDNDRRDSCDWNIFLTDKGPNTGTRSDTQRVSVSPVYSLSSPFPYSPTIFAGVEGRVIQLDFTSVYDRFPDPIFKFGSKRTGRDHRDAVCKWDPHHEAMCLAMYEQVRGSVTLKQQAVVGETGVEIQGWDERWRHL